MATFLDGRLPDRFWDKVMPCPTTGCWLWTASMGQRGYGRFRLSAERRSVNAHKVAYDALVGAVPEGLELDHLCRVKSCCNPDHLEPVTHLVNVLRGSGEAAINAAKTHCKRGHEFTTENTAIYRRADGRVLRNCKACWTVRYAEAKANTTTQTNNTERA